MEEYIIKGCPAYRDYDVFGLPNKGCCFCYMKYCKDVDSCNIKEVIRKCKAAMSYTPEADVVISSKATTSLMRDVLGILGYDK